MTIIITGATGGIGSQTLRTFHALGLPRSSYCGTSRNISSVPQELRDISDWRECTYDDPASMDKAFEGCTKLLLVSSPTFDNAHRITQHRNAIAAAKRAGVQRVYYTSLAFGGKTSVSKTAIMAAHLATEDMLKESGLDYTIIREGAYADAFPFYLNWFPDTTTSVKLPYDGPIAWTARDELGEGTAKLMLSDAHSKTYSGENFALLTAQECLTLQQTTALVAATLGKKIECEIIGFEEWKHWVVKQGKSEKLAETWGETYLGLSQGEGGHIDPLLEELLGRKPVNATEFIKKTLTEDPDYRWHQNERSSFR